MAKAKQLPDNFMLAINNPEGELMIKIDMDGNVVYLKDEANLTEMTKVFWNSSKTVVPVTQEDVKNYPKDAELGTFIRTRMQAK